MPANAYSLRARPVDALPILTVLLVALLGIPSALIVKPLGAAGTPAYMLAVGLLGWWVLARIIGPISYSLRKLTAIHLITGTFVAAMVLSYAHGMLRPIGGSETSAADRGLLALFAWAGLTLATADGLTSRETLDRFLIRLVTGGSAVAALGILQFFTGFDVAKILQIPGLTANHPFGEAGQRAAFRRVTATTLHPIEFGVLMSLLLPVAFHYAMHAATSRERRRAKVGTGLILVALPMTVARSAMVGLAVVMIMLFCAWGPRQQLCALLIAPFAAVGLRLAVPGLLGTVRGLFLHAGQDPSVTNRLGDYSAAGHYISQSPLLGRGFFTFLPNAYRTLDNQYIGTLIEGGIIGLLALMGLMIVGISVGLRVRRNTAEVATRSLAFALLTSMAVALVTFFTFDALSFPMATSVLFILLGAIGALSRLERRQERGSLRVVTDRTVSRSVLLATRATGVILALAVGGMALSAISDVHPTYGVSGSLVLSAGASGPDSGQNIFQTSRYLGDFPTVLARALTAPNERAAMIAAHHTGSYNLAVGDGSLQPGTDLAGTGNLLTIGSLASTPEQAIGTFNAVLAALQHDLNDWQQQLGVARDSQIRVQLSFLPTTAAVVPDSAKRAEIATILLVVAGWWCLDIAVRRRWGPRQRASGVRDAAALTHAEPVFQ